MDLHKKVIGNAVSAYFMIFVSIFFLLSKKPYINHPFVKSHVKSAFFLHILFFVMFFIMSFNFLNSIYLLGYSINTLITSCFSLLIFGMLLYGAWKAHTGKTITIGEIFHASGVKKDLLQHTETKDFTEEDNLHLILAHVPFLAYVVYPRHKDLPHIRDISLLNMLVTLLSICTLSLGYTSLASIFVLSYIIWSVFQSLRLIFENKLITLNLSSLPGPEDIYILQLSLIHYLANTFRRNTFEKFKDIVTKKIQTRHEKELSDLVKIKTRKISPIPNHIFYIPIINIIGIFFLRTKDTFHIRNGLVISIFFIATTLLKSWDSPLLLFTLLPICYGIGYSENKAYRMPYIYDFYNFFASIFTFIFHLFHKTRKLQKTDTHVSVKMNETK